MFPVMIDVTNQKIVIAGGGQIAFHKTENLLRFGICAHIISPDFHPGFEKLAAEGNVILHRKKVEWDDVKDAFLIMLVTDDAVANSRIASLAKKHGKLVVHAEQTDLGNAQIPAVLIRGKLMISVSTCGASPTLSKEIRDQLEDQFDERYDEYLEFLYNTRQYIKKHIDSRPERRKWLKKAAQSFYLDHPEERERYMAELTSVYPAL
ncbi:precorrin-2 dehydrogenase/sirohydrochlorin ferrochelatase family protein [Domibacillus epiphyticus]|uniref:precorrin-2 dehydrogenase n=1 Tax=Domibacillus epiphyticus TaxID=1714355 RepID=A0A1V2A8B3_9BACI|nr:NAD(P)-dependent oxidoreductase [Domibacillus epiphyticus]OMP67241.1 siroheme synthase [Domibacillus epiphyticus]